MKCCVLGRKALELVSNSFKCIIQIPFVCMYFVSMTSATWKIHSNHILLSSFLRVDYLTDIVYNYYSWSSFGFFSRLFGSWNMSLSICVHTKMHNIKFTFRISWFQFANNCIYIVQLWLNTSQIIPAVCIHTFTS